jgi:hypothetical protein
MGTSEGREEDVEGSGVELEVYIGGQWTVVSGQWSVDITAHQKRVRGTGSEGVIESGSH